MKVQDIHCTTETFYDFFEGELVAVNQNDPDPASSPVLRETTVILAEYRCISLMLLQDCHSLEIETELHQFQENSFCWLATMIPVDYK